MLDFSVDSRLSQKCIGESVCLQMNVYRHGHKESAVGFSVQVATGLQLDEFLHQYDNTCCRSHQARRICDQYSNYFLISYS